MKPRFGLKKGKDETDVPVWLYIWFAVIAIIKLSSITAGFIRQKKLVSVHSVLNKAAGLLLFVFPLTLAFMDLRYSAAVVCMAATAAAIQEGHYCHKLKLEEEQNVKLQDR